MTPAVLALCGFALLAALQGTEDAAYQWRPPPPPNPPAAETVCVNQDTPDPYCYTINR